VTEGDKDMACPLCGSKSFYVKDPNDEYEVYPFDLDGDSPVFSGDVDDSECPAIDSKTRTFCSKCAWNGRFEELR
jgi:hypothetical protein